MRPFPLVVAALLAAPAARAEFILRAPPAPVAHAAPARPVAHPRRAATPAKKAVTPVAEGFGRAVPLDLALQQIVPQGVAVRFAPGVAKDQAVDWSGGKPWTEVVRTTMQEAHLRATISPKLVQIDLEASD